MYVLDLEKTIVNGVWEGTIGRVNRGTIQVFTGKRFTGTEINNFYASGGIDDTRLKVFGEDGLIYITYETIELREVTNDIPISSKPIASVPTKVFVDEKNIEKILDRVYELELREGPKGDAGYTPRKGVDYFDGYTPIKGVDYFDGEKGDTGTNEWGEITNKPLEFPPSSHQHDASAIKVEDVNNYFTGTNVEVILGELFLFANNGKMDIASVVGSPATAENTFEQLKTHIQNAKNTVATPLGIVNTSTFNTLANTLVTQRNNIATAVNAKGVIASDSDTLPTLATKIRAIDTGKKQASGSLTVDISQSRDYGNEVYVSTGLTFRPTKVYAKISRLNSATNQDLSYFTNVFASNLATTTIKGVDIYDAFIFSISGIRTDGFFVNLKTGYNTGWLASTVTIDWYAYE